MSENRSRVQPGVPAGGQFTLETKTEPVLELGPVVVDDIDEAMDASGWREAMYDSDDPYGADLVDDQLAQASSLRTGDRVDLEAAVHQFHPDDLVGDPADPFEMVADADRTGDAVRLRTDRATLVVPDGYVVPRAAVSQDATDSAFSVDDLSAEQAAQFEVVHRHAYAYALALVGSRDVPDTDAAEEFASWGAARFVENDFDADSLSWSHEIGPWAQARRREQAAQAALARFPDDVRLLTEMTTGHGRPVSTRTPLPERNDLRDLLGTLRGAGFEVETHEFAGTKYTRLSGHTPNHSEDQDR